MRYKKEELVARLHEIRKCMALLKENHGYG
jgi:hypothetical protein